MKRKRFLAVAAALAISMACLSMPMPALATEPGEDYEDITDDEDEEGEQTTITAPGADGGSGGSSSGGSGSSGGSSSSGGGSSSSGSSGSAGASSPNAAGSAKSSDSSLASLGISPGSLSPAFSPGTYQYTATVDANVTKVSIPARPANSKAVIASVSGAKSIRPGTNTVKVVVEAENGTTSTYTITVYCGQGAQDTPASQPQDTTAPDMSEPATVDGQIGETKPQGEIVGVDEPEDSEEKEDEDSQISFDSNGYLIYQGNAYIPSELMPEGEYVSLKKYNDLYEQAQAAKTTSNRMMIIFVVGLVLLVIVIINLAFKLRDVRQDARLGMGLDDDETGDLYLRERKAARAERTARAAKTEKAAKPAKTPRTREKATTVDAGMIPDVKMPDLSGRERANAAERTVSEKTRPMTKTKPAAKAPEKKKSARRGDRDLEILDLNDL